MFTKIIKLLPLAMLAPMFALPVRADQMLVQSYANQPEATIMSVDRAKRTITVEFDQSHVVRTLKVAKNADIFAYDGLMRIPEDFSSFHVGETVDLKLSGTVKGVGQSARNG